MINFLPLIYSQYYQQFYLSNTKTFLNCDVYFDFKFPLKRFIQITTKKKSSKINTSFNIFPHTDTDRHAHNLYKWALRHVNQVSKRQGGDGLID